MQFKKTVIQLNDFSLKLAESSSHIYTHIALVNNCVYGIFIFLNKYRRLSSCLHHDQKMNTKVPP